MTAPISSKIEDLCGPRDKNSAEVSIRLNTASCVNCGDWYRWLNTGGEEDLSLAQIEMWACRNKDYQRGIYPDENKRIAKILLSHDYSPKGGQNWYPELLGSSSSYDQLFPDRSEYAKTQCDVARDRCISRFESKLAVFESTWRSEVENQSSPVQCEWTSYESCSEFVGSFDSLYQLRDISVYPGNNPMLLDPDAVSIPVSSTGNDRFNYIQFPIDYQTNPILSHDSIV